MRYLNGLLLKIKHRVAKKVPVASKSMEFVPRGGNIENLSSVGQSMLALPFYDEPYLTKCCHGVVEFGGVDNPCVIRDRRVVVEEDNESVVWSLIYKGDDIIALSLPYCSLCATPIKS